MDYKIVSSVSSEKDASVLPGVKWCSTVHTEEFEGCCKSMEVLFPIKGLATHANCVSRGPMDLVLQRECTHH